MLKSYVNHGIICLVNLITPSPGLTSRKCNKLKEDSKMAKTVKSSDYPVSIALKVFYMLNHETIQITKDSTLQALIVTDTEPKDLVYPEGWYYAKGSFRNKHMSSNGIYSEVLMMKSDGSFWGDEAKYCTLDS